MAAPKIDLRGLWFHRLFALRPVSKDDPSNNLGTLAWFCLCECGETTLARTGQLRKGQVKSCGCLVKIARQKRGEQLARSTRRRGGWNSHAKTPDAVFLGETEVPEEQAASKTLYDLELDEEITTLISEGRL